MATSPFEVPENPYDLAAGDLNGDGWDDVAVMAENAGKLSLFLSDGSGGFAPRVDAYESFLGTSVEIADFNNDLKLDVAFASRGYSTVCVLLGNGDGTLQNPVCGSVSSYVTDFAVADFNRDGDLDVAAVGRFGDEVSVLIGKGDGSFEDTVNYATDGGPFSIDAGDVNGDGKVDLVTGQYDDRTIKVHIGNGAGSFAPGFELDETFGIPKGLQIVDVTGDSKPDLVFAHQYGTVISVVPGKGDGDFGPSTNLPVPGASMEKSAVGDLNGDGLPDIAFARQGESGIGYLLNEGQGQFSEPVSFPATTSRSIRLLDANNDGRLDIGTVSWFGPMQINLNLGKPQGVIEGTAAGGVDFGSSPVGSAPQSRAVTFASRGDAALNLTGVSIIGPGASAFALSANSCAPGKMLVGTSCSVTVAFSPGVVGTASATLRFTHDGAGGETVVPLSATVLPRDQGGSAKPSIIPFKTKAQRANKKGIVRLAQLRCPAGAQACVVKAPRRVRVKIAGKPFSARVLAPKRIKPGSKAILRIRLPKRSLNLLGKASGRLRVSVTSGDAQASRRLAIAAKRAKPRMA
jgi:hypothetical protein